MKIKILCLICIVGLGGCPSLPEEKSLDVDKTKAAVQAVFDQYIAQLNDQNLTDLTRFFAEDARFYWVEDGQIQYPSRDSFLSSISNFLPSLERMDLKISKSKIDILSPETALLYAEYRQNASRQNGLSLDREGAFSIVLILESDTWRFLAGHTSTQKSQSDP